MNLSEWIEEIGEVYQTSKNFLSNEKKSIFLSGIVVPDRQDETTTLKNKLKEIYPPIANKKFDYQNFDEYTIKYGLTSLLPYIPEQYLTACEEFREILYKEFFKRVSNRYGFGEETRIKERFKMTLPENYRIPEGPFIDMAHTYWTFKLEVDDLFPQYHNIILAQLLKSVEFEIGSLFFPTPGPDKPPIEQRVKTQEMILETYAPNFNRKAFFESNPILNNLKDKEVKWPGFVYILIFSIIAWFVPQDVWWGKILFYILMGLIVICLYGVSKTIKTWIFGKGN